jgi:hypothetical protein
MHGMRRRSGRGGSRVAYPRGELNVPHRLSNANALMLTQMLRFNLAEAEAKPMMSNSPLSRPQWTSRAGVTLPTREVGGPALDFLEQVDLATAAERLPSPPFGSAALRPVGSNNRGRCPCDLWDLCRTPQILRADRRSRAEQKASMAEMIERNCGLGNVKRMAERQHCRCRTKRNSGRGASIAASITIGSG